MSSNSSDDEECEFKYSQPECIFIKSEPADADDANAHDKVSNIDLLPERSRESYWNTYDAFIKWKNEKNINVISEEVMLEYFEELSIKYKPSSLWCKYSMLRSTIEVKHNIKLGSFKQLLAFLKEKATGYEPKKSKVLTTENVKTFLNDAPDHIYLTTKVALIFGLFGGCRNCELVKLSVNEVIDHGQIIQVKLRDSKSKAVRTFIIEGEPLNLVRIYRALRPKNAITDRFFLQYRNGKCTNQPLGKNKFGSMPKEIAEFLRLPDSESYSGHAFRRSSAALNNDRDVTIDLKSLTGLRTTRPIDDSYLQAVKDKALYYTQRQMVKSSKQIYNDTAETSNIAEDITFDSELQDPLDIPEEEAQCHEKSAHTKADVQRWILHELEVMLSSVDAECTLEKLKKNRASLANKLAELQLQNESTNVTRNKDQIAELMKNIELINTQIEKLEQQIRESNKESKESSRWDFISTVADAKEALKSVFEVMASNRKEHSLLKNDLMEKNESLEREKNNLQMQCRSYKELLDNLSKRPKAKRKAASSFLVTEFF